MEYKKKFVSLQYILFAFFFIAGIASCSDDDTPEKSPERVDNVSFEVLKEYSFSDLKNVEKDLEKEYLGFSLTLVSIVGNSAKYDSDFQMRAYKVMLKSDNTDGSGTKIDLSGVLLVPPLEEGRKYRYVIAPPYTYVMSDDAPTVRVAGDNLEPHLVFWLLEAYKNGYAVMLPDYPGFGDSFGQTYIPYVQKEPMVRTTIEYVDAAQSVLAQKGYVQKDGLIISGYSLGAYMSLQLAREYETNSEYKDMKVDLLMTGGSPCNLLQEANLIRESSEMPQPYLFPLSLLGYKKNGYKNLVMSDYLLEPYASQTETWLDGTHADFNSFFTKTTSEMFTNAFLKNDNMDEINQILDENSVKPWKNSCRMIMTHGSSDETVYFRQAEDFADAQNEYGGKVTFKKTSGTHTSAGIWFYLDLYSKLNDFN